MCMQFFQHLCWKDYISPFVLVLRICQGSSYYINVCLSLGSILFWWSTCLLFCQNHTALDYCSFITILVILLYQSNFVLFFNILLVILGLLLTHTNSRKNLPFIIFHNIFLIFIFLDILTRFLLQEITSVPLNTLLSCICIFTFNFLSSLMKYLYKNICPRSSNLNTPFFHMLYFWFIRNFVCLFCSIFVFCFTFSSHKVALSVFVFVSVSVYSSEYTLKVGLYIWQIANSI